MQLLRLGIDLKVARQFFNRREAKQKPSHLERAIIYLFIYFHAFNNLRATARRGDWFMALFGFLL